jgi:hypothetical protein
MPYSGSVSADVEDELVYMVSKLVGLRTKASNARTPAELDAAIAEMRVTVSRGMRTGHSWANDDLKGVFNNSFKELSGGATKPKTAIDASYRLRKKSKTAMFRLDLSLNSWVDDQKKSVVAGKQLAALEKAMAGKTGDDFVKLRKQAQEIRKGIGSVQEIPSVTYFSKKGQHAAVAQMPAPTYIRTALKAGHVDNENQGLIRGALAGGVDMLFVHDGDECGWVTHDSLPRADGMEVEVREALAHPKAHPNCQRSFSLPSKAERKAAAERERARKAAQKLAAAAKRQAQKQKLVQAAKVTAKAAAVGVKLYKSPATQLLIKNIVEDRWALPAGMQEFVAKFAKYGAQEKAVAASATSVERQEVSTAEVRQRILEWADNIIGAEDATHKVPVAMQKVLGLPATATTDRITQATWSYGDWVATDTAKTGSSVDNIVNSGVWAEARQELFDSNPVLASYFHIGNPRGVNVGDATGQTIRVIRDAFTKDADQITEEAIKELATAIDPFYWISGRFGPARMSVRMSTEGRRDLAAKLFRQIRDTRRWSQVDRDAAAELGVKLVHPVDLKDIHRALLPRLTLNPGGLFSFTVSSESGNIKPIFRVLPQWAATRYFGGEFTLAQGAGGRIKQAVQEGANLGDVLRGLPDEVITHLNMYRNGPLNAHVNFWGTRFNGYSVYLGKDTDWIRLANRYRRYERVGPGLGQIVPLNRMWTELSVMPNNWSTVTFTGKNKQFDVLVNLHRWSGSLVHIAREMRIDYFSLKHWYAQAQQFTNYQLDRMNASELAQVRSYADLRRYADGFVDHTRALADIDLPSAPIGRHNVSPLLEHNGSKSLLGDVDRFNGAWDVLFPHVRRPALDIYTPGSAGFESDTANLFSRGGTTYIRSDLAANWGDMAQIRKRNVFINFWPAGTEDPVAALWHEAAHNLMDKVGERGMADLFRRLRNDLPDLPKYMLNRIPTPDEIPVNEFRVKGDLLEKLQQIFMGKPETRQWVRNNLSGYATRNIHETISEAFTEYMTSAHPRPFAMVIGHWLEVYGGL